MRDLRRTIALERQSRARTPDPNDVRAFEFLDSIAQHIFSKPLRARDSRANATRTIRTLSRLPCKRRAMATADRGAATSDDG